jgi:hypothetical protein
MVERRGGRPQTGRDKIARGWACGDMIVPYRTIPYRTRLGRYICTSPLLIIFSKHRVRYYASMITGACFTDDLESWNSYFCLSWWYVQTLRGTFVNTDFRIRSFEIKWSVTSAHNWRLESEEIARSYPRKLMRHLWCCLDFQNYSLGRPYSLLDYFLWVAWPYVARTPFLHRSLLSVVVHICWPSASWLASFAFLIELLPRTPLLRSPIHNLQVMPKIWVLNLMVPPYRCECGAQEL